MFDIKLRVTCGCQEPTTVFLLFDELVAECWNDVEVEVIIDDVHSSEFCVKSLADWVNPYTYTFIAPGTTKLLRFLQNSMERCRDVTGLGLGGPSPPKNVAAPSNCNGNRSFFLHGCFGHHAAVG